MVHTVEFADGPYASRDERVMRRCCQLQTSERKRLYWCRKLLRCCKSVITKRRCSWHYFLLLLSIASFSQMWERGQQQKAPRSRYDSLARRVSCA